MINTRITRKYIESYDNVLIIPYGELPCIFDYLDRDGYNTASLGWNYDYYHIVLKNKTLAVVTGYRVPKFKVHSLVCFYSTNKNLKAIDNEMLEYTETHDFQDCRIKAECLLMRLFDLGF